MNQTTASLSGTPGGVEQIPPGGENPVQQLPRTSLANAPIMNMLKLIEHLKHACKLHLLLIKNSV